MSYFETKAKTEFASWFLAVAASLGMLLPAHSYANDELDVFQSIELPEVEIDFDDSKQPQKTPEVAQPSRPAPAPAPSVQTPVKNQVPPLPVRAPKRPPVPAQIINRPEQSLHEFVQAQSPQKETSIPTQQNVVTDAPTNNSQSNTSITDPFQPIELPPIVVETNPGKTSSDVDGFTGVSKPVQNKRPKKLKVKAPPVPEDEAEMPAIKAPNTSLNQGKKKSKLAPPADDEFPSETVATDDPADVAVPPKAAKKGQTTVKSEGEPSSVVVPKPASSVAVPKPASNNASNDPVRTLPIKKDEAKKVVENKPKIESGIGKTLAEFAEGKLSQAGNTNVATKDEKNEKETEPAKCGTNQEKPSALTSQAEEIIKALEQASCRGCSKLAMLREKLSALKLTDDAASKLEAQALLEDAAKALREMQRESSGKLTRLQVREAVAFMRVAEEKDLHRAFIEKAQDTLVASKDLVLDEIRRRPEAERRQQEAPSRLEQFAQPRLKDAYKKIDEIEI